MECLILFRYIERNISNTMFLAFIYTYYKCEKFFLCVCIIKLLCHFLPDLAQILNKAMNSKGAASKPVPGADFTQLLILRHLFVSHTQILADSQSDCEKVVEPKRNPNRTDFFGIQLSMALLCGHYVHGKQARFWRSFPLTDKYFICPLIIFIRQFPPWFALMVYKYSVSLNSYITQLIRYY